MIEESKKFVSRYDLFPFLINTMKLVHGVEVGTREGRFAKHLIEQCANLNLTCVDISFEKLEPFSKKINLIEKPSVKAALEFDNDSLDFVYIDACHQYKEVVNDLGAWWPKLRVGGLFSGDDYIFNKPFGVIQAVDEFEQKYQQKVNLLVFGQGTSQERHKFVKSYVKPKGKGFYKTILSWWCVKC